MQMLGKCVGVSISRVWERRDCGAIVSLRDVRYQVFPFYLQQLPPNICLLSLQLVLIPRAPPKHPRCLSFARVCVFARCRRQMSESWCWKTGQKGHKCSNCPVNWRWELHLGICAPLSGSCSSAAVIFKVFDPPVGWRSTFWSRFLQRGMKCVRLVPLFGCSLPVTL